jgi:uncharacterized OB-fold protein
MAPTETDPTPELTAENCPPLPEMNELTAFFWDGVNEHRLLVLRCDNCGKYVHWPRPVCRFCSSTSLTPAQVSGRARLHTWTIPLQPFDPYFLDRLPYVLAVVELDEQPGLMMVTDIVDCAEEELRMDMPVEVTFREVAPGYTLPLFKPAA